MPDARRPLYRALPLAALLVPAVAFAFHAVGPLDSYSDGLNAAQVNSASSSPGAWDEGGRYVHWYGSRYSASAQSNIATALTNGTLLVDYTIHGSIQAGGGNGTTTDDVYVVVCQANDSSVDPSQDTGCTCKDGTVVTSYTASTYENHHMAPACTGVPYMNLNQSFGHPLPATSATFDDESWICLSWEATSHAWRDGSGCGWAMANTTLHNASISY